MKEFITAIEDELAEQAEEEPFVEFKLDDRVMRAYRPNEGQLVFIMAALGRGQTTENRYASIVNLMMEALRNDDRDYFESRLLTRDPKTRLKLKQVEAIFEYVTEEWFARPTQPSSDSAESPQNGGEN